MQGDRFFYMLPKMIVKIDAIRDLLIAEDVEFSKTEELLERMTANSYLSSIADEAAITGYEKIFNVKTFGDLETRRSMLVAKLRGAGTTTADLVKNVAESFTYGEVELIQDHGSYIVKIKFVGEKGIPANLEALKQSLAAAVPAHLKIEYIFTYMTWGEYEDYNKTCGEWDDLNLTVEELEKYQEVI